MTGKSKKSAGPPPFEVALEQHGPKVHGWLVARMGPERADDVFQETMLAALRAWDQANPETLRPWLFTIAGNKAIDEDRRAVRRPDPQAEPDAWPSDEVTDRLEDPVWDEVMALPEKQRAAVTLRFRGDLTHREIGLVMRTSEGAARRNVFEGLRNLRERINDE